MRALISSEVNTALLQASPVGLLALVLQHKARFWGQWDARVWSSLNTVEGFKKLAPKEWVTYVPSEEKTKELEDADILQSKLSEVGVQINHTLMIVEGGLRLGAFCKQAISVVHGEEHVQGSLMMGGTLSPGDRELLLERIRCPVSICEGLVERFNELQRRHQAHLGQVHNHIAQSESKTNRAVAQLSLEIARVTASDSRTMKAIGLVELIFLPAIFISTLWGAVGIVELDEDTNKHVFAAVILTLTATVLCCWALYMRFSRKPFSERHGDFTADLGVV